MSGYAMVLLGLLLALVAPYLEGQLCLLRRLCAPMHTVFRSTFSGPPPYCGIDARKNVRYNEKCRTQLPPIQLSSRIHKPDVNRHSERLDLSSPEQTCTMLRHFEHNVAGIACS